MTAEDDVEKRLARLEEQMKVLAEVHQLLADIKAARAVVVGAKGKG